MRQDRDQRRTRLADKNILLGVIFLASLLFFYACLQMIPGRTSSETHALLRGAAKMLAFLFPAFLYLRTVDGEERAVLGGMPSSALIWRLLLLLIGAFFFGIFAGELSRFGGVNPYLFSSFRYPTAFSLPSFAAFCIFVLASALLPFGVMYSRLISFSPIKAILPMAFFYAAMSISVWGTLLLLAFGSLLAVLRIQTNSFFAVFLCNFAFLFGAYGRRVGILAAFNFGVLPQWGVLLLYGGIGIILCLLAVNYRYLRDLGRKEDRREGKAWIFWTAFSALILVVSLLCALIGKK